MDKIDYMHRLILLLAEINFAPRYYGIYESMPKGNALIKLTVDEYKAVIESVTNMPFHYNKKEKFFGTEEFWGALPVKFNIALYHEIAIEFILAIYCSVGCVGGTYHGLAYKTSQLERPGFSYVPRYPRLHFTTLEELHSILRFGLEIYEKIKCGVKNNAALFGE